MYTKTSLNGKITRPGLQRLLDYLGVLQREVDTPFYAYDYTSILDTVNLICAASRAAGFGDNSGFYLAFFAIPNLSLFKALLRENRQLGIGCNTPEEIEALKNGGFCEWDRVVFSGGVLPRSDLIEVLKTGCLVNTASAGNLQIAATYGGDTRIGLRLDFTNNALKGVTLKQLGCSYGIVRAAGKQLDCLHAYPGTEVEDLESLVRHACVLIDQVAGFPDVSEVNFGGGFWYNYNHITGDPSAMVDFRRYFAAVREYSDRALPDRNIQYCWEPGRVVFANSGFFVTEVLEVRKTGGVCADVYVDASFTQIPTPKIRNRQYKVVVTDQHGNIKSGTRYDCRICGATTLSTDQILPRPCPLPEVNPGDLLIILDVGAYGRAGSYNFLGKAMPPEVLIKDGHWNVIRERQRNDHLLEGLNSVS